MQGLGTGTVVFGIHIAAPALAFGAESALDKLARERLSTVYMPGWKLTMLPDEVVQAYTLTAGRACPAVSLYVTLDEATLEVRGSETRLERVAIVSNLRHDQLDAVITEASLTGAAPAAYEHAAELAFAFRLARHLKASARWCAASRKPSTAPTTTSGSTATKAASRRARARADQHAPARRAAGPDRRRGDDPRQQHLGRLARRSAACPASTAARPAWRRA